MLTSDAVDELVQRFHGWNRQGEHGVLRYYNSAHSLLMAMECEQNVIFDDTTGLLPAVNTTAGTFAYLMPSNVWKIDAVLIPLDDGQVHLMTDYGQANTRMLRTSYQNAVSIGGRLYARWPYARSQPYANASTLAKILFTKDPETTIDYYFRKSYKRPTEILSETIQGDIPEPLDTEFLLPATAKLIEGVQSGNYLEAYQWVSGEFKKEFWKRRNSGDQGYLDAEPVDRGF